MLLYSNSLDKIQAIITVLYYYQKTENWTDNLKLNKQNVFEAVIRFQLKNPAKVSLSFKLQPQIVSGYILAIAI